jgi:hypothetical protein
MVDINLNGGEGLASGGGSSSSDDEVVVGEDDLDDTATSSFGSTGNAIVGNSPTDANNLNCVKSLSSDMEKVIISDHVSFFQNELVEKNLFGEESLPPAGLGWLAGNTRFSGQYV